MADSPREITQLLLEWSKGDRNALDRLMPLVYEELHQLARRYMATEPPGHTLQTTALIHEAYLRLINQKQTPQNRVTVMRDWKLAKAWILRELSEVKA